ncbi:MAG: Xaa-Pro peptidase family protein [Thermoleophilia bacterium]
MTERGFSRHAAPRQAVPTRELKTRMARFQEGLRRAGIDVALIVQNADLYYLAGTVQQSHLFVPAEGDPLFLVRRDPQRAAEETPLAVEPLTSSKTLGGVLERLGLTPSATLGLELDVLPARHYLRYRRMYPEAELVDCSAVLLDQRAIKSDWELQVLEECARLAEDSLAQTAARIEEGMTEIEVSGILEGTMRRLGHQGLVRFRAFNQEMLQAHVFAGPGAGRSTYMDGPLGGQGLGPAVSQGASRRVIRRGEAIVIDFPGTKDGYLVDQTRTLCVGPLPADLKEAYAACLDIEQLVQETARAGVACGEVYEAAVRRAQELGYGSGFMGYPAPVRFIGHGVGIELDELPVLVQGSDRVLATGNVVAVEPKVVLPDRGTVGVENTWVVGPEGLRRITTARNEVWEL